ncbi:MAG: hypothetical protein ACRC6L_09500, partial [Steroidobacteraceae bacterium]
ETTRSGWTRCSATRGRVRLVRGGQMRRSHDLMDVNAGTSAAGSASIEDVGWQLFRLMPDVASGRRKTWAEPNKDGIWPASDRQATRQTRNCPAA